MDPLFGYIKTLDFGDMSETKNKYEKIKILNTALLVIVILLLLFKQCGSGNGGPTEPTIIRDTTSIVTYDTITNETVSYVPQYYEREVVKYIHDTVTQIEYKIEPTDTAAILEDYFAKYYYIDTILQSDSFTFIVYDTITQNQIAGRSSKYDIIYPTITNTITEKHYINARELYLGFNTGVTFEPFDMAFIDMGLMLRTKKRFMIGVKGGLQWPYENELGVVKARPYVGIGYYHKITNK